MGLLDKRVRFMQCLGVAQVLWNAGYCIANRRHTYKRKPGATHAPGGSAGWRSETFMTQGCQAPNACLPGLETSRPGRPGCLKPGGRWLLLPASQASRNGTPQHSSAGLFVLLVRNRPHTVHMHAAGAVWTTHCQSCPGASWKPAWLQCTSSSGGCEAGPCSSS